MIATLFVWIYILLLTTVYGLIFQRLLLRAGLLKNEEQNPSMDIVSLTGLCFLIIILSYVSLFYKIGAVTHLCILTIAVIYLVFNIKEAYIYVSGKIQHLIRINKAEIVYYILIIVIVLICATLSIEDFDTGYYHAQIIQWIEKYKVIPGLGNISPVLAYNQSIYLPSALFSFSFLNLPSFHLVNSYLFLVLIIRLLYMALNSNYLKMIYPFLILYFLKVHYNFISSDSSDLPAFIFITYIVLLFTDNSFDSFNLNSFSIFLFGIIALTIKLSALPILLLVIIAFYSIYRLVNSRQIFILIFIFVLSLGPWIARNIILSGYLIYPFPSIDLFNVDWKIRMADVQTQRDFIKSWSVIPVKLKEVVRLVNHNTFYGVLNWEEGVNRAYFNMSYFEIIVAFCKENNALKLALYLLSYSTILLVPFMLFNLSKLKKDSTVVITWSVFYLGIIFISLAAPDFRLGSIFFLFTFILGLYILLLLIKQKLPGLTIAREEIIARGSTKIIIVISGILIALNNYSGFTKTWLFPIPYKNVETMSASKISDLVRTPKGEDDYFRCWNEPLPCIPCQADTIKFRFRSKNIEDGFRPNN